MATVVTDFTTAGTQTFTPPPGVTVLTMVEHLGAGAGGSCGSGPGGGSGEYAAETNVAVTPGHTYTWSNGAGGAPAVIGGYTTGQAGGNTTSTWDAVTITAHGAPANNAITWGVECYSNGGTGSGNSAHRDGSGGSGWCGPTNGGGGGAGAPSAIASGTAGLVNTGSVPGVGAAAGSGSLGGGGAGGGWGTSGATGGTVGGPGGFGAGGGSGGATSGGQYNAGQSSGGAGGNGVTRITYSTVTVQVSATIPTRTNWYGGFTFQVLVVTGGLAGGNTNATGTGGSANADLVFTPAQSSSLLCWMVADAITGGGYTAAASNTIYSQNAGNGYGFGYYSGTVAGGTGAVVGTTRTGAAHEFNNMVVEIVPAVAGVSPVIDGSTPVMVQATGTTYTAATGLFTPPAGAVLMVLCGASPYSSGTGLAPVISDTAGLTWTAQRSQGGTTSLLPMVVATAVVPVPCAAALGGAGGVTAVGVVTGHATLPGAGAVAGLGAQAGKSTVTATSAVTGAAAVAGVTELDGTSTTAGYPNSQSAELDGTTTLTAGAAGPGGTEMDAMTYLTAIGVVGGAVELDGQGGCGAMPAIVYSALLAAETDMT